jgi:hypothetical protein
MYNNRMRRESNPAAIRRASIRETLQAVFARHAPTDGELRALAVALQVPYVELWALAGEAVDRPRLTGADVEEWLAWHERDQEPHEAGTRPVSHRTGE